MTQLDRLKGWRLGVLGLVTVLITVASTTVWSEPLQRAPGILMAQAGASQSTDVSKNPFVNGGITRGPQPIPVPVPVPVVPGPGYYGGPSPYGYGAPGVGGYPYGGNPYGAYPYGGYGFPAPYQYTPGFGNEPFTGPKAGKIQLVIDPVDAQVFIDGHEVKQLPDLSYVVNLLEGRHRLQIAKDGFKPYDQPLDVPGGGGFVLAVQLEK